MSQATVTILAVLFLVVGMLYASVGHAGASGYLAVMALVGLDPAVMRPTALAVNILVAAVAFAQFARAGHFSWRLTLPFAVASVPAAYIGGLAHVPIGVLKVTIGAVLLASAAWMVWRTVSPAPLNRDVRPPKPGTAVLCGGVIGAASGLTGTGGGIFLSPLMVLNRWADLKHTAATAALFILVNSASGLVGQVSTGWRPQPWLWVLAASACAGGVIGAHAGSRLLNQQGLRLLLSVVVVIAGIKLVTA